MSKKNNEEVKLPWYKRLKGWQYVLLNIVALAVAAVLLLWGAMLFLDVYTRNHSSFRMPDVKGMTQADAIARLKKDKLYMEITDSIYVAGEVPGIILETTPKAGTLIKNKRTIYVTVNTMSVKTLPIPSFEEQSERSVEMILRGTGFTDIIKVYTPSPHDQLVLSIKDATGRYLMPGDRVPYTTQLILEIASAEEYQALMLDSLAMGDVDSLGLSLETSPGEPPIEETDDDGGELWF